MIMISLCRRRRSRSRFFGNSVFAGEIVAADLAVRVDQDEAGAVVQAAIHFVQLERVEAEIVERGLSPVRKVQRSGSALKCRAYSASTGGVSCAGSTVNETSLTSGISTAVGSWMPCIWWLIIGHGPSQVV